MTDPTKLVPQFQKIIHPEKGDCNRACVATITGIPIDELPTYADGRYYPDLQEVLDKHGWVYFEFPPTDWWWFFIALRNVPVIASVPSQMFEGKQHAIVVRCTPESRLEVLHDPNWNNKPFDKLTPKQVLGWSLLIRKDGLPRIETPA